MCDDVVRRPPVDVCPYCKRTLETVRVTAGDSVADVQRCTEHNDVVPMRSTVVNYRADRPVWDGEGP